MSFSSKVRKFSCRVLDFRYIFLIFISHQNKLVCAPRASKKMTRFVPLRVHFLEYIAEAKIGHLFLLVVFSPRQMFIFVVRMQCISVDFT